jgi:hypothetical protein
VPSLRELERDLRAALLGGDDGPARAAVQGDGLDPGARLGIYRHHVTTTLTAALQATFPVVCRLVDERFFAYAADRFIRDTPPSGPCLFEYGADFADFLAGFPPCHALSYLADVARLEWALQRALHAPEAAPLPMRAVEGVAPEAAASLTFSLDASASWLASPYPTDRIWRANQTDAPGPEVVDLAAGEARLEARRRGDHAIFAFRRALATGANLAAATGAALAVDPTFGLAPALVALFEDELPVAFTCTPSHPADQPCQSQP